jgi:hypothetical protein
MNKIQQDLSLVSMRIVATTSDQRKAKRNTTHTRTVTHMALYQMSIRFAQMPTMDSRQPIKLLYELTKWIWHTTVIENKTQTWTVRKTHSKIYANQHRGI